MIHIHIGHHFYGGGNIGDDWMLAGFLQALTTAGLEARLTCCIPHDREAMQLRFPRIEWLEYDRAVRRRAIAEATVWLGLGDTPFQLDSGPWLLDHILEDLTDCRTHNTAVFFLGVGVENAEVLRSPQTARIVQQARHIWTRDKISAQLLAEADRSGSAVSAAADLAHVYFSALPPSQLAKKPKGRQAGLIINVEKAAQLDLDPLSELIMEHNACPVRWIAQDVRNLAISEMCLWERFESPLRKCLTLSLPDYHGGTLKSFLSLFDGISVLISTRYHGALAAAWLGSAVSIFARSGKLTSLIEQLEADRCESLTDKSAMASSLANASTIPRDRLEELSRQAAGACREFFALLPPEGKFPAIKVRGDTRGQLRELRMNSEAFEQGFLERGQIIEQQRQKLGKIEGEFDRRLKELTALYASAETLKNERNLLQAQLADLGKNFAAVEADRLARGQLIEEQGRKLTRLEGEFDACLKELTALYASAEALKNERNLLQARLADLGENFAAVEADRLARGQLIEEQGRKLTRLEGEFDARLKELTALYASAEALKNERNLFEARLADLQKNFAAAEADRLARGQIIDDQGRRVAELEKLIWLTEQNRDYWKDLHAKSNAP